MEGKECQDYQLLSVYINILFVTEVKHVKFIYFVLWIKELING